MRRSRTPPRCCRCLDKPTFALNPAIRLLLLLALATALPMMSLPALTVLAVLFLGLYRWHAAGALRHLAQGLVRLRWLLIAIFVLYGAFTPGTPLLPQLPGLSSEGLSEGARRALVIINLLTLVYLLLAVTPVGDLVPAIELLLRPLRPFGVDNRRIGLRLALALDTVLQLRAQISRDGGGASLLDRAAAVIVDIETTAAAPATPMSLPPSALPRWWEWALPLTVLVVLHGWTP